MKSNNNLLTLLALSLLMGASCNLLRGQTNEQDSINSKNVEQRTTLPDSIIEKANQFIISRVGDDFFNKYISLNDSISRHCPVPDFLIKNPGHCAAYLLKPYYFMVYSFAIPEKPFVDELISFVVDTCGNFIAEREPSIPNCLKEPIECDFPIDEGRAIEIAKNAGLEAGIRDWETSFGWSYGEVKSFVWAVSNTLSENRQDGTSNGKTVMIDANTGELIQISNWEAMP